MKPTFFPNSVAFRHWLEKHHASDNELRIGFYKKASGKVAMTYQEAVLEALCFGWIDGIVNRIDAESYTHRFTPRKPGSTWSQINVAHVARLTAAGRMHPAGLAAFQARSAAKTGIYSFERKTPPQLAPAAEKEFRANRRAWAFFQTQPPGYRRTALHFVVSAKLEATRMRRLARLIADSTAGRRLREIEYGA